MTAVPPAVHQAAARQEFLRAASDLGADRLKWYTRYDEYMDGTQHTLLGDRAELYLRRSGLPFSENFCETIVEILCARLKIDGFTCEGGKDNYQPSGEDAQTDAKDGDKADPAEDLASQLGEWWKHTKMDAKSGTVHVAMVQKGDGFLIVDYDPVKGCPRFTFNRPEICKPVYDEDDPDHMLYFVKVWNEKWRPLNPDGTPVTGSEQDKPEPIRRMNIYWPDRVEKWFSTVIDAGRASTANWHPWMDPTDTGWPVMWLRNDGTPRGIPVFHFRHKAQGRPFGVSKLRGVMPQQDGLNKSVIDLHMVMDYEGMPSRWATGVADTTTAKFTVAPGEVWVGGEGVNYGQFDGASPEGPIASINGQLSRIAARARVPVHQLIPTALPPSGETLKVAESPLVADAEDVQTSTSPPWEGAMGMAVGLHNDFAPEDQPRFDEELIIEVQWRSAASRDDLAQAQVAQIYHDLGASASTLLAEAGYNPEEEREQRDDENQRAMDNGSLTAGDPTVDPVTGAPIVREDAPRPVDGPPATGA